MERDLNQTYVIRGYSGIQAVQSRLVEFGMCHFTTWDPGPPQWRFIFDTFLTQRELETTLSDLLRRYEIKIDKKK
jgi:hypothetical protein